MHILLLVAALLVGFCFGCVQPPPAIDLDAERQKLEEAVDGYHSAAGSMEIEKIVALYTSDARILPPDAPEVKGTAEVRTFASSLAALPGFNAQFEEPVIHISPSGDMAFSLTNARLSYNDPAGTPVVQDARDLHVWRKDTDGFWKVALDMWNSGSPPAAPPTTSSP